MASGRKLSCKHDPDNSAFCTGGTACNVCYPSLLNEGDLSDGSGENNGYDPLFQSHLEDEPAVPQDSHSSLPQPCGAESSSFQHYPPQTDVPNIPNHPLPQYVSSFAQGTQLWPKVQTNIKRIPIYFEAISSKHQQNRGPLSREVMPNEPISNQNLYSSLRKLIETDANQGLQSDMTITFDPSLQTRRQSMINRWVANQNLHFSTGLYTKAETCEIQRLSSLPEAAAQSNPINHQVPYFQQQPKRESSTIPPSLPRASFSRPLPAYYFSVGWKNTNTSPRRPSESVDIKEDNDFITHVIPHLGIFERVNIVLYGPAVWSSKLLKTFSVETPCGFHSPCSLSCQRDITRGPISMSVFVWQAEDIVRSRYRIRDFYNASKTTIVIVKNVTESFYMISCIDLVIGIRREINRNVPIILVLCRDNECNRSKFSIRHGYLLKAVNNLSAYLECHVDSTEEVENVFLTAMDVSLLKYRNM